MKEVLGAETASELCAETLHESRHDLPTTLRSRLLEDVVTNALSNVPVQQSQLRIDSLSRAFAGRLDKLANV